MTKISFIGGGSVQWMPGLVSDIAFTPTLDGAELVLHDIDLAALKRMVPLARRIAAHHGASLRISGTLDRQRALRGADAVVLCVGIGGLAAARSDLEIPAAFGIYQSVGDTVGPGGLARGLRHIPFAATVAREMETLCPEAWLINLTNPMTTICRAIAKSTAIRTVGLCHEVSGFRAQLAGLFDTRTERVILSVGGINHLPVILDCRVAGQDGLTLLSDWLDEHGPMVFVKEDHSRDRDELGSPFAVFQDAMAVKFTLFQTTGVLFGAGDRHVAEFVPGLLDERADHGLRYGVRLTTPDHRAAMLDQRRKDVADGLIPQQISDEQLAPLLAALFGGPDGRFVVNVPNEGQISNLPLGAAIECVAHVDALGVRPLAVGDLPRAAHAVVAPHVDRQELIVESALSDNLELAEAALASNPLIQDPTIVSELLSQLLAANARAMSAAAPDPDALEAKEVEMNEINERPAPEPEQPTPEQGTGKRGPAAVLSVLSGLLKGSRTGEASIEKLSVETATIGQLLARDETRTILERHFQEAIGHPQVRMAAGMTLIQAARYAPKIVTDTKLAAIEAELRELEA
ncbi:MAG: hypothetical protein ACP5JG_01190 [Anaerolineae bacterium]